MIPGLIALGIVVVLIFSLIAIYNGLVAKRVQCENGWSQIDVQLKRRHDLIPNIVQTVKGYAKHERETLDAVITARSRAVGATGVEDQAQAEGLLTAALGKLFALSEAYPDLKANTNYLHLQKELANTEDRIQAARRFYNANVRDLNTRLQVIPSNIVGNMFSFQRADFFELDSESERNVPQVSV
jgi:LemA protein